MRLKGLPPIYNENTEILILGTFPGIQSLNSNQYYNDFRNQFWRILGRIFNKNFKILMYRDKIKLLLDKKIGLWDVINSCERKGSTDKEINNPEFNDFQSLGITNLKKLICHSSRTIDYLKNCNVEKDVKILRVPSPSSMNTHYTEKEKAELWKEQISGNYKPVIEPKINNRFKS